MPLAYIIKGRFHGKNGVESMRGKRRNTGMLIATIIMAVLAAVLLYIGFSRGQGQHVTGLSMAFWTTVEILPLLLFAFIVAGMVQALIPPEYVSRWVGEEAGFRGIMIGTVAGGLTPGGPYVSLPVAAGLMKSGASVGTLVAFLTGWAIIGIGRIPMEVGIIGWKLTAIRLVCSFFFPPVAGLIAQAFFSGPR
jgi:uncharacterized membrane protein YraQ (UPF0718 family)